MPEWIRNMVESEVKDSANPRDTKTEIINKLFALNPNTNRWELNIADPYFREKRLRYEKRSAKDGQEALEEDIMCGLYFKNDTQAMQRAIDKGSLKVTYAEDGTKFLVLRRLEASVEKGGIIEGETGGKHYISREQKAWEIIR